MNSHALVVIIDGVCVMCNKFARFVTYFNPDAKLMWAQNESAKQFLTSVNISFEDVMRSIVVVKNDKVYRGSDAFIAVLLTMNLFFKFIACLMMLFPKPLREWVYQKVADNRYYLFGKTDTCPLPSPEMRSKFLHSI